jgi:hypothetical protein
MMGDRMHIEIDRRGSEPLHYFNVGVRAAQEGRLVHVGYIMRARPTDEEWFACIKYRTGAPVLLPGGSVDALLPEIRKHIIERAAELRA